MEFIVYSPVMKFIFSVLQERLNRQQEENDLERKRLEDLIGRLETQLREQTRMLDEVRNRHVPCLTKSYISKGIQRDLIMFMKFNFHRHVPFSQILIIISGRTWYFTVKKHNHVNHSATFTFTCVWLF